MSSRLPTLTTPRRGNCTETRRCSTSQCRGRLRRDCGKAGSGARSADAAGERTRTAELASSEPHKDRTQVCWSVFLYAAGRAPLRGRQSVVCVRTNTDRTGNGIFFFCKTIASHFAASVFVPRGVPAAAPPGRVGAGAENRRPKFRRTRKHKRQTGRHPRRLVGTDSSLSVPRTQTPPARPSSQSQRASEWDGCGRVNEGLPLAALPPTRAAYSETTLSSLNY